MCVCLTSYVCVYPFNLRYLFDQLSLNSLFVVFFFMAALDGNTLCFDVSHVKGEGRYTLLYEIVQGFAVPFSSSESTGGSCP